MLRSAYRTDVGRGRTVNEDRVVVKEGVAGGLLAIVADGMGGHRAGDTASQITIELVEHALREADASGRLGKEEREASLVEAIRQANAKVFEIASLREHYRGMGTTVTVALADEHSVLIGHIGDSRAYYINHEQFTQITEDHTLVNELVKTGQLTPDEAAHHPRRNVVTRALGTQPDVAVDVSHMAWSPGDMLMLCSDGLTNMVPPEVMIRLLRSEESLETKSERLVEYALAAGGDDNITLGLIANESQP